MGEFINSVCVSAKTKLEYGSLFLKKKMNNFLTKEDGDVNVVSLVVLIGVAVVLAIIFKDAISKLLESLLETISGKAQEAVSD